MDCERIIYSLNVADAQNVVNEIIDRALTTAELKKVENVIGDFISWYDSLEMAIIHVSE